MLYLRSYFCALLFASTIFCTVGCHTEQEREEEEENEMFSERDELELAMRQEFFMTRDPQLNAIPKDRLFAAQTIMQRLLAARGGANDINWQERGPNNIAGRTRAFFIDSRDASGNTIFAASVSGGIWKCTNFKSTPSWTPLDESMANLAVCALAQDPSSPNVMYAGTGEGWFNNDAVRGNGIWKSINGGATWSQLPNTDSAARGHAFDFVQDIVVNQNGIVFATARPSKYCNQGGVMRSSDGGTTWQQVIGTLKAQLCDSAYNYYGADLEIAANGDLYATTGFGNGGELNRLGRIFRSDAAVNGTSVGAVNTWKDITPPGNWKRIDIACAPSNPAVVYALLQGTGDGIGAIQKTTDFGATWTDLPLPTICTQGVNKTDFTNDQSWFDLIVAVDPNDDKTAFIGGLDVLKTTDGGATWQQVTQWASGCSLPTIHADQHNIKFYPGSSTELIVSNDGGLFYSGNKGLSWSTYTMPTVYPGYSSSLSEKNTGYNVTQFYACAIHPQKTDYILAGAQDNGSQRFLQPGMNATTEVSLGGDGGFCHIDQVDGKVQVLTYVYNNFFYSRDDGASFTRIKFNNNGFFINPSDYDNVKKVLYSGNNTNQIGLVTNLKGPGNPVFSAVVVAALDSCKISAIRVDPTDANGGTIWVAGSDSSFRKRPILLKIQNAHTTAPTVVKSKVLTGVPAGAYVSSVDVDPANGEHILATLSNFGVTSVYESTNGGSSFTAIEGNLPDMPVRWGMFVPATASVNGTKAGGILLATELGVWYAASTSGNSTVWEPQNKGLPNIRTDMLKLRPSDNLLAAATHGRGLFTTNLTSLATGLPVVDNTKNFIKYISTAPQRLLILKGNLNTTKIKIEVFDANGRLVHQATEPYANLSLSTAAWAAGTYTIKITGNKNERFVQQFIK